MKYKHLITPLHFIIISFYCVLYLFLDINPFSLIFIYSYITVFACQIFTARFLNKEDLLLITWANFNSVFVLSIFLIINSYYYRISILMILFMPLIHMFFVKLMIKYDFLKFQTQKLEVFFFILFSTVFIPLTSNEYDDSRAIFFTLVFFIFGFLFYSVYYKFTSRKLLFYQKFKDIFWLSSSSFLYAYLLSGGLVGIPLFFAATGSGLTSNVNYFLNNNMLDYYEFVNNMYYTYFISIFYLFLLILQIRESKLAGGCVNERIN